MSEEKTELKKEDLAQIFCTRYEPLAAALFNAGCELVGTTNVYSVAKIRQEAQRHPTWDMEGYGKLISGVRKLLPRWRSKYGKTEQGISGEVVWKFRRNQDLDECIDAWKAVGELYDKAEKTGVAPSLPDIPHVVSMQVAAIANGNRLGFKRAAFQGQIMISTLAAQASGSDPLEGGKMMHRGSGKVFDIDSSKEDLIHMFGTDRV